MIRALAVLLLSAGTAAADQDCMRNFVSVSDVRLTDGGWIEADIHNRSPFPVIGYDLFYVFSFDTGTFTEDLPTYILKTAIVPGRTHTHRMRLSDFDLDIDRKAPEIDVHVVGAHPDLGIADDDDTSLDMALRDCLSLQASDASVQPFPDFLTADTVAAKPELTQEQRVGCLKEMLPVSDVAVLEGHDNDAVMTFNLTNNAEVSIDTFMFSYRILKEGTLWSGSNRVVHTDDPLAPGEVRSFRLETGKSDLDRSNALVEVEVSVLDVNNRIDDKVASLISRMPIWHLSKYICEET